jgi:hypothetical protein
MTMRWILPLVLVAAVRTRSDAASRNERQRNLRFNGGQGRFSSFEYGGQLLDNVPENEGFWRTALKQTMSIPLVPDVSVEPSESPSNDTAVTDAPTLSPTNSTTIEETDAPTTQATNAPTESPTAQVATPTEAPVVEATILPTISNASGNDLDEISEWETTGIAVRGRMVDISGDAQRMVVAVDDSHMSVYSAMSGMPVGSDILVPTMEQNDTFLILRSVGISGDGSRVAMATVSGAMALEDGTRLRRGRVQVFEYSDSSSTWTQVGSDIDGDPNDDFGYSVSLSFDGSRVAAGAPFAPNRRGPGYVKVFEYDGSDWSQLGSTLQGPTRLGSGFGFSIELSSDGSTVVVGMPYASSEGLIWLGHVEVHSLSSDGNQWNQLGQALDGTIEYDQFGIKVAIAKGERDDWTIATTSISSIGSLRGLVQVYRLHDSSSEWVPLGSPISGISPENLLGEQMDLRGGGNIVAVGDTGGGDGSSGYIIVQQWNGNEWTIVGTIIRGDMNYLGIHVAISEDGLLVAGTEQELATGAYFTSVFAANFAK